MCLNTQTSAICRSKQFWLYLYKLYSLLKKQKIELRFCTVLSLMTGSARLHQIVLKALFSWK